MAASRTIHIAVIFYWPKSVRSPVSDYNFRILLQALQSLRIPGKKYESYTLEGGERTDITLLICQSNE